MDRQLKRHQVTETSIPFSVDAILHPDAGGAGGGGGGLSASQQDAPLALRLSGQLLLGVVRVYARKMAYLQQVRGNNRAGLL